MSAQDNFLKSENIVNAWSTFAIKCSSTKNYLIRMNSALEYAERAINQEYKNNVKVENSVFFIKCYILISFINEELGNLTNAGIALFKAGCKSEFAASHGILLKSEYIAQHLYYRAGILSSKACNKFFAGECFLNCVLDYQASHLSLTSFERDYIRKVLRLALAHFEHERLNSDCMTQQEILCNRILSKIDAKEGLYLQSANSFFRLHRISMDENFDFLSALVCLVAEGIINLDTNKIKICINMITDESRKERNSLLRFTSEYILGELISSVESLESGYPLSDEAAREALGNALKHLASHTRENAKHWHEKFCFELVDLFGHSFL